MASACCAALLVATAALIGAWEIRATALAKPVTVTTSVVTKIQATDGSPTAHFGKSETVEDDDVYVAADGTKLGTVAAFEQLGPAQQKQVTANFDANGGTLVHNHCAIILAKDKSWSAGYCTHTVLQHFGAKEKPSS